MKKIALLFLIYLIPLFASSQTLTSAQAINKSGRQRAISQRIAKDYLMILAGIKTEEATKDLEEYSSIFNENIYDLTLYVESRETLYSKEIVYSKNNKETKETRETKKNKENKENKVTIEAKNLLTNITEIWRQLRLEISETPSQANAVKVIEDANTLLVLSNSLTEKIVSQSGLKSGMLVNTSGKQRMYLQRISLFYLSKYLNLSGDYSLQMKDAVSNFESGLENLLLSSENTPQITTLLKLQRQEWIYFKKSIYNPNNMLPGTIFSSSNLMVKNFETITKLYEDVVSKES